MSWKEAITRTNIQGILAIIVIFSGFHILSSTKEADIKIAIVGLMGTVLGYYFGSSQKTQLNSDK
jgi:hypothetical protein